MMRTLLLALVLLLGASLSQATASDVLQVTTLDADGPYTVGAVIHLVVVFDTAVTVTGSGPTAPLLLLNAQPIGTVGNYVSTGTGAQSNEVFFDYTVAATDTSPLLDVVDSASLKLEGGSIVGGSPSRQLDCTLPVGSATTGSLPSAHALAIETGTTTASIESITAPQGSDATYGTHKTLQIEVNFDEPVFLVLGLAPPTLTLTSNGGTATYQSGSGSATLLFTYTPLLGQAKQDVDVMSFNAVAGQVVCSSVGNPDQQADLTVPTLGGPDSLSALNINIYTTQPVITKVFSSPSIATYGIGGVVPIQVQFSTSVVVVGTPTLSLATGSLSPVVSYSSGSGTSVLTFNYTVGAGQNTSLLDYISPPLQPLSTNGGTIRDLATNDANLASIPNASVPRSGSLKDNATITIDTTPATVTTVTSLQTGTVRSGTIMIQVHFTGPVTALKLNVTGAPTLALNIVGVTRVATYNDSETQAFTQVASAWTMVFDYAIQPGDESLRLDYLTFQSLSLNGGTISDAGGNAASLNLPTPGTAQALWVEDITIDTPAAVLSVSAPGVVNGTLFKKGTTIPIQVQFSKPVTVTPVSGPTTPTVQLNSGTSAMPTIATYQSGSGTTDLLFNYTVGDGDLASPLDCLSTSALQLNGSTIQDAASVDAAIVLPLGNDSALSAAHLSVNGVIPIIATIHATPSSGDYTIGQPIPIILTFNEPVVVAGTPAPALSLNVTTPGGANAMATYTTGSGTANLIFTMTVVAGENVSPLDTAGTTIIFNGATISDLAGNGCMGTLPLPGAVTGLSKTSAITIDTTAPTIIGVTSTPAAMSYGQGQTIPITVTFSENIAVTPSGAMPSLMLNTGRAAVFAGASGSIMSFTYAVLPTDAALSPLNYASTGALALNGAVVQDAATNGANLTLPPTTGTASLAASNISISISHPIVSMVSSTSASGVYTTGDVIDLIVTFPVPVMVTGTPTLALNTSPSSGRANYVSGSSTNTLSFTYTVAANQNTSLLDASGISALAGTITDANGNAALLAVPVGTTAGSLASTSTIAIETSAGTAAPRVISLTSPTANGSYVTGQSVEVDVNFTAPVTVTGAPHLQLNAQGTASSQATGTYVGGSGSTTLRFTYVVATGNTTQQLDASETNSLVLSGSTIADPFFSAIVSLPQPGAANSLASSSAIKINPDSPSGKPGTGMVPTSSASSSGCGLGGGAALLGLSLLLTGRRRGVPPGRDRQPRA